MIKYAGFKYSYKYSGVSAAFFGKKIPAQAFKPVPVVLLFAAAAIVTADAFKF